MTSYDPERLDSMAATLRVRAIDAETQFFEEEFCFFHAHLQISDLDKDTSQPFIYGNLIVGLVGEIYNASFLLESIGIYSHHEDFTECAVIARLYATLGTRGIDLINGEFAISIYDRVEKSLFVCRDRWGTNNLYYTIRDGVFLFASEIKSLIFETPELDPTSLIEHLIFQFDISPTTRIRGISTLRPGTYGIWRAGRLEIGEFSPYESQDPQDTIIATIERSVMRRIPKFQSRIFVSLSGGPDSNLILFFLQKYFSGEIIAYSFLSEKNKEEIDIARTNTRQQGVKHLILDSAKILLDPLSSIQTHEGLVQLPDLGQILRDQYPEYGDIKVEFGGDGKEELLDSNIHFPYREIIARYRYFHDRGRIRDIDISQSFLNREMFDYNLQMIDKITLRNGIERRLPFTDYEMLRYQKYTTYRSEAQEFLRGHGLRVVSGEYGYNLGIDFTYGTTDQLSHYCRLLLTHLSPLHPCHRLSTHS